MTGPARAATALFLATAGFGLGRWTLPEPEPVVELTSAPAYADPAWREAFAEVKSAPGADGLRQTAHEALNTAETGPALVDAIELMGWTGEDRDAEWLEAIARSEDRELQEPAIEALGRLGTPRAIEALLRLTERDGTRQAAVRALGSTGDPRAYAKLVASLDDPELASFAAWGLARFGTDAAASEVATALGRARANQIHGLTQALARFPGDHARELLYDQLRTGTRFQRDAALSALADVRDPMVLDLLLDDLERGATHQRIQAANHLGRLGDPTAVLPLKNAALSGSRNLQGSAVAALAAIEGHTAREAMLDLVDTGPETVAQQAIWALRHPEREDAVEVLLGSWSRRSWNTRSAITQRLFTARWTRGEVPAAVLALAREELSEPPPGGNVSSPAFLLEYGEIDDVTAVEHALSDGSSQLRSRIVWALAEWPGADRLLIDRIDDPDPNVRDAAVRVLIQRGASAELLEQPLIDLLHSDKLQHGQTQQLLVELGTPAALAAVQAQLENGTQREQSSAIQALSWSGDQRAVDLLRRTAADTDDLGARRNIYQTLMWSGGGPSDELVTDLLADDDPQIRAIATQALAQQGPEGRTRLLQLARDEDEVVRSAAMSNLGQAGGPEAEQLLVEALEDPMLRHQALSGLQQIGSQTSRQAVLDAALTHEDPGLRSAAVSQLAWMGVDGAPEALEAALADEDAMVRQSALSALEGLGSTGAAERIERLLDDDDEVALQAAYALQRMGGAVAERNRSAIEDLVEMPQDSGDYEPELYFGMEEW